MENNDNIIQIERYSRSIKSLDKIPTFERFLSLLRSEIEKDAIPYKYIDWWETNNHRVEANRPHIEFVQFLASVYLVNGEEPQEQIKDKEIESKPLSPESQRIQNMGAEVAKQTITRIETFNELSEKIFGYRDFHIVFDYLSTGHGDNVKSEFEEYYNVFKPHDPLKELASTIKLYCWDENIREQSVEEWRRRMPTNKSTVYTNSDLGVFITNLADWSTKDIGDPNYPRAVFIGILGGQDYDLREKRLEMVDAAINCPYAIFELFINYFWFCNAEELRKVLNLPFKHKPSPNDKSALNADILNNINYDGCYPYRKEDVDPEKIKETLKEFYSNYSHYRRRHFDGVTPILNSAHAYIINLVECLIEMPDYDSLPYIRDELGADISVLWSLYLYWNIIDDMLFSPERKAYAPENKEEVMSRVVMALYYSLVDEFQYMAAINYLAATIFKLSNMTDSSFESYTGIYSLIDNAMLLPTKDIEPLRRAIQYAADTARKNSNKLTESRLLCYLSSDDTKWRDLIATGETKTCEFKQTIRWNVREKRNDKNMEHIILKNVAALLNTAGGYLFVGVDDDGDVIGLEQDGFKNMDKLQIHFQNRLRALIGNTDGYIETHTPIVNGKEIFVVECTKASAPVYFEDKLYVRRGPSTTALELPNAVDYIKESFKSL